MNGNCGVVVCNPNTKVRLNGRTMHHNHWGLFAVEHAEVDLFTVKTRMFTPTWRGVFLQSVMVKFRFIYLHNTTRRTTMKKKIEIKSLVDLSKTLKRVLS